MRKKGAFAAACLTVLLSGAAAAQPIQLNDYDEGYSRLARWEQHLDDVIANGIRDGSMDPRRGWEMQKQLDAIEMRVLQSYYESDSGIDQSTFRRYAGQLRDLSSELGQGNWGQRNLYGDGWYDDRSPDRNGSWSGSGYGDRPYYRQGDYETSCRQGNTAAGTIFGALAGGLIGGAASHGNGGAVLGGVILGGLVGNALTRDIDCSDHRYAFDAYDRSLNGDLDRDYDWRNGDHRGSFTSTREYRQGAWTCRDFRVVTYRDGQRLERQGSACRDESGLWQTR